MRVLITGGAGFLAGAVASAARERGHAVDAPPRLELDVADAAAVRNALAGVEAVVHTAYRPVHAGAEADAAAVNVGGAATVAEAAHALGVRVVHVSSDVVFPGDGRWHREADQPGPLAGFAYGEQKAAAERLVRRSAPTATIVRTSLLWDGRGGGSLERLVLRSAAPGSAVAHFVDELRCPVHVDDVAAGILDVLDDDEPPPVLHLAGPRPLDRHTIAVALATTAGIDPAILRAGSSTDHPGPRPLDLRLDSGLARSRYGWRPRNLRTS